MLVFQKVLLCLLVTLVLRFTLLSYYRRLFHMVYWAGRRIVAVFPTKKCSSVPKAYSGLCQTRKMGCYAKIVNRLLPLTILAEHSILDDWQGFKYVSVFVLYLIKVAWARGLFSAVSNMYDKHFLRKKINL